jgi:hypothetical protein
LARKKANSDALAPHRSEHVVITQRDRRRLKCRKCGESERMGDGEMPSPVREQFEWVVKYNEQVEGFLAAHKH